MEMNLEKPKLRSAAKSRTAVHSAPLCEMKEMLPGRGMRAEKLAFRRTLGKGLITPRQLGPIMRTPASRQMATMRSSMARPSGPTSRKPAETMTMPFTPRATASCTDCSAALGGRITMPRSSGSGMSLIEG